MPVNLIESFDGIGFNTEVQPQWTSEGGAPFTDTNGRFGDQYGAVYFLSASYALSADPGNVGTSDKLIIGFGFKMDDFSGTPHNLMQFRDDTDEMAKIQLNSDGTVSLVVDAATIHTSDDVVLPNSWHYCEIKILLNDGAGTCQFQIDGRVGESEGTTLVTLWTANGGTAVDNVRFSSTPTNIDLYLDDIYMGDDSDAMDFLGDVRILTLLPTADSGSPDFTPSSGDNYTNVDDTRSTGSDTDYNQSNTSAHQDMFTLETSGILAADTIHAIQANMWSQKVDGGAVNMHLEIDSNSTTAQSAEITQNTSYGWYRFLLDEDPDTTAPWTDTAVDALIAGYSRV